MIGWLVAWSAVALADWTVEGPASTDRAEATADGKAGKDAGFKTRVVRRFADGSGWEYVVRVEGLDEQGALAAAKALAGLWADSVTVFDDDGKATVVGSGTPEVVASAGAADPANDHLGKAIEAHGNALAWVSDGDRVKLVYVRSLPDGREVKHTYARRGTDLYLSIEPTKGEAKSSRTLALGESAWLWEGTSKPTSQDLQRARETIERFGPTAAIPVVLGLDRAAADHPELEGLEDRGTAKVGEVLCVVAGSRAGQADVMIAFGEKDGLVRRIAFEKGVRTHEYDDYTKVSDGIRIPRVVRSVVDGAPRDTVRIVELEVDGDLPETWFVAP